MDKTQNEQEQLYAKKNINVERARQILGPKADKFKDREIWELLNMLYFLSGQMVKESITK